MYWSDDMRENILEKTNERCDICDNTIHKVVDVGKWHYMWCSTCGTIYKYDEGLENSWIIVPNLVQE